jgi:hypothetical protein
VQFDVWLNIHYGYVGKAAGFSDLELLVGAGAAQIISKMKNKDSRADYLRAVARREIMPRAYGDYVRDQFAIQLGIDIWNSYGLIEDENQFRIIFKNEFISRYNNSPAYQ